jgi:fibronectin type 3 domain-containing protein
VNSEEKTMKAIAPIVIVASLLFTGCERILLPDQLPPGPPTGLWTSTGDNFIELFWDTNPERDIAGYNVFVSSSYDGRYELIGSTRVPSFVDYGARNGNR